MSHSLFFFSSRRRHTRYIGDWSSDVCSSDLNSTPPCKGFESIAVQPCAKLRVSMRKNDGELRGFPQFRRCSSEGPFLSEIGRASCRERVYVSVGAGYVKKMSGGWVVGATSHE